MMNGMSPNNSPCLQINVFTANKYWLLALSISVASNFLYTVENGYRLLVSILTHIKLLTVQ